jgi:hypothetical protein
VAVDDPAKIARLGRAQNVGRAGGLPTRCQQLLGRLEGGDEPHLIGGVELAQHRRHRLARAGIDCRVECLARLAERDDKPPAVMLRGPPLDQPLLFEPGENAAQIAGIKTEFGCELGRRRPLALRQFPDHPAFGQRQRAAGQPLAQDADLAGVKPAEPPDDCNPIVQFVHIDTTGPLKIVDIII